MTLSVDNCTPVTLNQIHVQQSPKVCNYCSDILLHFFGRQAEHVNMFDDVISYTYICNLWRAERLYNKKFWLN